MAICSFFLQGRCKFGDRCWNEHPRDGRHQGHNRYQSQGSAASSNWNSSGQRYVQPSTFSKNLTWTKRDNDRGSFGSGSDDNRNRSSKPNDSSGFYTPQNRFGALANQDHGRDGGQDIEDSPLADIIQDMESWEVSGQWPLSVYCVLKEQQHLSGFTDISPEELRLECYTSHEAGHLQNYMSSVQQLLNQWKQRVHEIKNWNPSSTSALLNQLTKPPIVTAQPTFGGLQQSGSFGGLQQSGFGTSSTSADKTVSAATFSFKLDSQSATPNAGASSSFSSAPAFGSKSSVGFATTGTGSASSFSFVPTTTSGGTTSIFSSFGSASSAPTAAAPGFGSSVSSGFGGTTVTSGFGSSASAGETFGGITTTGFGGLSSSTGTSGFGAATTGACSVGTPGTSLFGQVVTVRNSSNTVGSSATNAMLSSALFTPRNELSQEDLLQFESKTFTLGKVPLMPPPADLLSIK
ncbi:nucleoporin NUP42-like [Phyllobates terribilis]|uniref:nucleoporin NUP42-like n=1 Tax=Phyllobates terribilis TaxID=111132 RepID=UPI003CCAC7A3